jgi:hypothetical protein
MARGKFQHLALAPEAGLGVCGRSLQDDTSIVHDGGVAAELTYKSPLREA